jgi:hypothetical protein
MKNGEILIERIKELDEEQKSGQYKIK